AGPERPSSLGHRSRASVPTPKNSQGQHPAAAIQPLDAVLHSPQSVRRPSRGAFALPPLESTGRWVLHADALRANAWLVERPPTLPVIGFRSAIETPRRLCGLPSARRYAAPHRSDSASIHSVLVLA